MEQPQGPVYREDIKTRTDPDARNARAALVLDNFLTSTDKYRHNQYRDRNGRPSFLWPQQGRMLLGSDIRLRELAEVDSEGRVVPTRGLVVSPGASGKTALIAGAMEFAGIGRETPCGTLRGMVTTGSRFVPQTAKELARFLPELKITTTHGDQTAPDMSGDLIVVGHGMLPKHYADGTLGRQGIDLWTADEAHRLLGPQIHECAERLVEEHHSWGYTATPDLADPTKSAYNLFKNEFYRTGNREMIKAGHIQGVQLYGLVTRARIRAPRGNEDYTEEDLEPLARDPERNAAIVSVALKMLEEGRKVVINCIEGGGSAHARLIADILNTQKISGRLVKAVAAGDFMGSSKLSRVMQDVVNNEYDVLVQTYVGEESLNWPQVSGVIMTRPTRSPRRAHQRAARGQRKGSGFDYTIMVEFFDQLEGRDRLTFEDMYTLWDVYELSDRHQGQLVLSDERVRRRTIRAVGRVSSHDSGFDIECLSLQTQEELDRFRGLGIDRMVEHFAATVDRANISKQPERKSGEWLPMRPYCVSLQAKAGSKKPLNTASVLNILRLGGFGNEHTNVRDTTAGPRYEISVIAAAYLDTYEFPERASPQDKPLTLFAVEHGVSVSKAIELLQGAGIPLSERRSHSGLATPGRYILEECLDAANAAMSNRFTITSEEAQSRFVTIPELAARNGIESSTGIAGFIAYYKSQPEQHWVPGRDGFVAHYPKDIGEIVDYHYSLPRLTRSQIALEHLLSDFIEEDADKFTRFLHEKGYIQQFPPARYLPRQKSQAAAKGDPNQQMQPEADKQLHWVYTLQCSRADARRFVREFMIGLAAARSQHPDIGETSALATPEDAISSFENVGLLAKECRCDPGATKFILEKIIKSAHFSSITYKGGELFVKKFLANDFRRMCEEVVSSRLVTEEVSAYTVAGHIKETYGQSLEEYGIKFTEASVWNLARDLRLTCRLRLTDEIQPIVTLFYPKKELWKIDNFVKSDIARRQAFARPSSP